MNNELFQRIASSILLILAAIFFIFNGPILFILFILCCYFISAFEWQKMSKYKSYNYLGHIFLVFSFLSVYLIRYSDENSLTNFIFALVICVSTDIGGYIFGRIFNGPKLTRISPKKTYMGVFGGFLLAIVSTFVIMKLLETFLSNDFILNMNNLILIILISAVSQAGDILISYFKRLSKLKDSGNLIPGHGGILDRIDGMIFAFPFYYLIILISK